MLGAIMVAAMALACWLHWQKYWRRSGLMNPRKRREMNASLTMPGGVYYADMGIPAFVLVVFYIIDPILRDHGVPTQTLTVLTLMTLVITMGAMHGSWTLAKVYLQRHDAMLEERQKVASLVRS